MHVGLKLIADIGTPFTNIANYQHLEGKLTFFNTHETGQLLTFYDLVPLPDEGEL